MILMWLSTHPFYSKIPRHIISGAGYNMFSLRTTQPAECQPHEGDYRASLFLVQLKAHLKGLLCMWNFAGQRIEGFFVFKELLKICSEKHR